MAAADDVDDLIGRFHQTLDEFVKGHPEPCKELLFHREDVTLNNPFGPPTRGWDEVAATMDRAASNFREGALVAVTGVGEVRDPRVRLRRMAGERRKAKMGGRGEVTPSTLRVTMIFRPEDGTWRVVHHHADPITTPRPTETVIQE